MKLEVARKIALDLAERLRPFCRRVEVAGSIRRSKPEVRDIEIVALPDTRDLEKLRRLRDHLNDVAVFGQCRGKFPAKYIQRSLVMVPGYVKADFFFTSPGNWGLILVIRTGSRDFNVKTLLPALREQGYVMDGGYIRKLDGGERVPTPEETDVFRLAGLPWLPPERRK